MPLGLRCDVHHMSGVFAGPRRTMALGPMSDLAGNTVCSEFSLSSASEGKGQTNILMRDDFSGARSRLFWADGCATDVPRRLDFTPNLSPHELSHREGMR